MAFSPEYRMLQTFYLSSVSRAPGARHYTRGGVRVLGCPGSWVSAGRPRSARGAPRSFGIPPTSACCAMLHFASPPTPYRLPGGVWHTIAQTKAKSTLKCTSGYDFAFLLCSTSIKAKKHRCVVRCFGRLFSVCVLLRKPQTASVLRLNCLIAPLHTHRKRLSETLCKNRKKLQFRQKREKNSAKVRFFGLKLYIVVCFLIVSLLFFKSY